ncbi:hypothetical protein IJG96_02165 [Candidatus Saccharibacteria bacterium]|nr:hypothetical protein [Candidatus Saccharibacteria bacterium]
MPAKTTPAPYWDKKGNESTAAEDLAWNFPEQKQGTVSIIGGNREAFSTEVKIADYLFKHFPMIKEVKNHLPDSLKKKLPPFENLNFCPSTETGSFTPSNELTASIVGSDMVIVSGDLSKNSLTTVAISRLIQFAPESTQFILTRDTVDLVKDEAFSFIERDGIFLVASLAQLQKLFRALFYPRPILLSSPIFPIIETLHKFTLSYPVSLITFHERKIICASHGDLVTIDIATTDFTPLSLWSGDLVARLAAFAMFNPKKPLDAMVAAVNYK